VDSLIGRTIESGGRASPARLTPWWRARRGLLIAFALSVLVHIAVSLAPEDLPETPDATPLTASIRELPPPPPPAASPRPPAPKARPVPRRAPPPPATAPSTLEAPPEQTPSEPSSADEPAGSTGSEPPAEAASPAEPAPVLAEEVPAPPEPSLPAKVLPPRVDLAYKVFYGATAFHVGDATYRFEHEGGNYRVSTLGEARGLAALFVRGRGRVESRGVINGEGLQPLEIVVDKFNRRGTERAIFDWEVGVATLTDGETVSLDVPTFDPLTLMWQFYFKPPDADRQSFALATTRRVQRVAITRIRAETIEWTHGAIDTEVWHRTSDDGRTEAYVWLAPSLNYIPVKIRTEHTTRGTLIALLDAIRVDDTPPTAPP
jgi:hypothetical protein